VIGVEPMADANFKQAREVVLNLLRQQGRAKNSELLATVGGDEALLQLVREDLIFNDLAKDKDGVGLIYAGPAAAPQRQTHRPGPGSSSATAAAMHAPWLIGSAWTSPRPASTSGAIPAKSCPARSGSRRSWTAYAAPRWW